MTSVEQPVALVLASASPRRREILGALGLSFRVVASEVDETCAERETAEGYVARLAGRAHEVTTAVALVSPANGLRAEESTTTRVWFRSLADDEVARYVASGDGRDKAGAYAVQGLGSGLVTRVKGSYSNVVGLPAAETLALLRSVGAVGRWP